MSDDAKKIAASIMGDTEDEGGEEEAKMPPLDEVMGEFIAAVKAGDAKAAAKAFRAANACSSEVSEEDDE